MSELPDRDSRPDPRSHLDPWRHVDAEHRPDHNEAAGYTITLVSPRGTFTNGARITFTLTDPGGGVTFSGRGVVTTGYADVICAAIRRTVQSAECGQPGQQSGGGQQPTSDGVRNAAGRAAAGDDPPRPVAGLSEAGVPDSIPHLGPFALAHEHQNRPRPFWHEHSHDHAIPLFHVADVGDNHAHTDTYDHHSL